MQKQVSQQTLSSLGGLLKKLISENQDALKGERRRSCRSECSGVKRSRPEEKIWLYLGEVKAESSDCDPTRLRGRQAGVG